MLIWRQDWANMYSIPSWSTRLTPEIRHLVYLHIVIANKLSQGRWWLQAVCFIRDRLQRTKFETSQN